MLDIQIDRHAMTSELHEQVISHYITKGKLDQMFHEDETVA